ncbi:hypothetical protein PILCRDRAFT_9623, partial [Piloderma croceum F 1598]
MDFEAALARLPHLSESEKCTQFYNRCKSDFDAEDWYENLEKNTPAAVTSWSTLVLHFRVKWLRASPDSLLKMDSVTSAPLDAATLNNNANTTTTTTTIIPAPANTATPAIYETTKTPEQYDHVANARHDNTPPTSAPTRSEVKQTTTATTTATTTNPDNTIMMAKQQDDEELAVGGKEEERGLEKQMGTREREARRRETGAGEQGRMGMTQDGVRDPAPSPTAHIVPAMPSNSTTPTLINPAPGDPIVDPDRTARTGTAPVNSIPVPTSPVPMDPIPVNPVPDDATVDPVRTASANAVPTDPIPVDATPVYTTNPVCTASVNAVPTIPIPIPVNPRLANPNPITTLQPKPAEPAPAPINPVPGDAIVNPDRTARTSTAPVNSILVNPDP